MDNKHRILIVDDDEIVFDLIECALADEFELVYSSSGSEAISALECKNFQLVILDVGLPDVTGYEICRHIRADDCMADIGVIFLSGYDSLEYRIKGYEAGADDYIEKPFDTTEVRAKICVAIKNIEERKKAKQKAAGAFEAAMTAITSAGELGVILHFLKKSFSCDEAESLAGEIITACTDYGLNVIVRLKTSDLPVFSGTDGDGTELEKSLFDHVADDLHIYSFNNRCIFNFGDVALLVKNMPTENDEKCGRIRDNCALLCEASNASLKGILSTQKIVFQQEKLRKMMKYSSGILEIIDRKSIDQRDGSINIMSKLVDEVESSFMNLGLTDNQEREFLSMVSKAETSLLSLLELGNVVEGHVLKLMHEFRGMLEQ